MQDRYTADFGDYVKLALLRKIMPERRLAVAWFRNEEIEARGEGAKPGKGDGRHTEYLRQDRERWRALDPELFDGLEQIIATGYRRVAALEPLLAGPPVLLREQKGPNVRGPSVTFYGRTLTPTTCRSIWFVGLTQFAFRADILFLDPDNGITLGSEPSRKHVAAEEVDYLAGSVGTLVVYHHFSRLGSHPDQLRELGRCLLLSYSYKALCAIECRRWSPRVFFILGPDQQTWDRVEDFAEQWKGVVAMHRFTERPDGLGLTPGASAWHRADALEARGSLPEVAQEEPVRIGGNQSGAVDG